MYIHLRMGYASSKPIDFEQDPQSCWFTIGMEIYQQQWGYEEECRNALGVQSPQVIAFISFQMCSRGCPTYSDPYLSNIFLGRMSCNEEPNHRLTSRFSIEEPHWCV